jgi:hypothetical protein
MMRGIVGVVLLSLVLTGCVGFRSITADRAADVGNDVTVQPKMQWATGINQNVTGPIWTVDGFGLNELRFYTGIQGGDRLFQIQGVSLAEIPRYSPTMLPDEVMEMISTTLVKSGATQVRTDGLHPVPFGTIMGFRFDLTFATAEGLEMKGIALFAQRRNKLDTILYMAPSEYYFDRYAPEVEKVFASVTVPDSPAAAK